MGQTRMTQKQKPAKKFLVRTMRLDRRSNRETGVPWGTEGWPDVIDPLDLTLEIFGVTPAQYASLAALQGDDNYGDGNLEYNGGATFTAGQYVILANATLASYNGSVWAAGAKA